MRDRILDESNSPAHRYIVDVVRQGNARLLYSFIHLDEIEQIRINKYVDEHINLLDALKAVYIHPWTKNLDYRSASQIWRDYLRNRTENQATGINDLVAAGELTGKKLSGLPIKESLENLHQLSQDALMNMLNEGEKTLQSLEAENLTDTEKQLHVHFRERFADLKQQASQLESLKVPDETKLGPHVFRELLQAKDLDFDNISPDRIIPEIENLFVVRSGVRWDITQFVENTIENQIGHCYFLMNWAGYYPDDFTKIKQRSDRYRASSRDMMHTLFAVHSQYFITDDNALGKKAKACYAHLQLPVIVVTPEEFESRFEK